MRQTFGWLIKICRKTYSIHFKIMSFNETNKLMIQMVASFQLLSLPFQLILSVHAYKMCLLSGDYDWVNEFVVLFNRVRFCLFNISFRFVFYLMLFLFLLSATHKFSIFPSLCACVSLVFPVIDLQFYFRLFEIQMCIVFALRSSCTFMRWHEICIQQINRRVHWLFVVSCFEFDHKMLLFQALFLIHK